MDPITCQEKISEWSVTLLHWPWLRNRLNVLIGTIIHTHKAWLYGVSFNGNVWILKWRYCTIWVHISGHVLEVIDSWRVLRGTSSHPPPPQTAWPQRGPRQSAAIDPWRKQTINDNETVSANLEECGRFFWIHLLPGQPSDIFGILHDFQNGFHPLPFSEFTKN